MHATGSPAAEPGSGAATAAGIYAALLGSENVTATDKKSAEILLHSAPEAGDLALINWEWGRRVARFLITECGIRQIYDLGSGIPVPPLVHEMDPDVRVVYVDNDRYAVNKSQEILHGTPNAVCVLGDVQDTNAVLGHPAARDLIDITQPIAIIMGSLIHFVPEDADPVQLVRTYVNSIPSGSYLALTCAVRDLMPADMVAQFKRIANVYKTQTMARPDMRDRAAVESYFAGLDLVPPGIVAPGRWRPDDRSVVDSQGLAHVLMLSAVGRKP